MSSRSIKECEGECDDQDVVVSKRRVRRGNHELFDKIAFNVLSYLESFDEVDNIDFTASEGSNSLCSVWEGKNKPYSLPIDIKGFSSLFNGVTLKWSVEVGNSSVGIGEIKVNKVEAMIPVDMHGLFMRCTVGSDVNILPPDTTTAAGFEIAKFAEGVVVLLYRSKKSSDMESSSEIWYQDTPNSTWHFVCHTFTQYLRLCVLHLGIYGWHKIFSPEGISMTTRQWMGMFCRERLCVYQHHISQNKKSDK